MTYKINNPKNPKDIDFEEFIKRYVTEDGTQSTRANQIKAENVPFKRTYDKPKKQADSYGRFDKSDTSLAG